VNFLKLQILNNKYMNKLHLTAPCGLYCFNCPAYEGNITEDYMTRVSEFLNIWREDIRE